MITASAVGFAIPGTPKHVAAARRQLADFLTEADATNNLDDVLVAGSELITNAILHSASGLPDGTVAVRAEAAPGGWTQVEVRDQGPIPPAATRSPFQTAAVGRCEGGYGLGLVAGLSGAEFGEFTDPDGTHVAWFRIPVARPADKRHHIDDQAGVGREVAR